MRRSLFSSDGLPLLSLPVTRAERENRRRRNVIDLGAATASRILGETGIRPDGPLMICGDRNHCVGLLRGLLRRSPLPFVLVGTGPDLEESCLLALEPDWTSAAPTPRLQDGSGALALDMSDEGIYLQLKSCVPQWTDHLVILCLGSGLQVDAQLLDQLNGLNRYIILSQSLHRSIRSTEGTRIGVDVLLDSMDYILVSAIGTAAEELLQTLPAFESVRVTNAADFSTHRNEPRSFARQRLQDRDCGGLGFTQSRVLETRPVLTQDDLRRLQSSRATLFYNTRTGQTWTAKIL